MNTQVEFVTQQADMERLCAAWRASGKFAFDTEFIRDDTFDAILCLVQVAADDGVALIDPTTGLDMAPFWRVVADPAVLKVVHAGKEDFEVCLTAIGSPPQNVFDVQIAAGLAGHSFPMNLVRLVDQVINRRIVKGETLTDWLRRPLTDDQFRYAVEDVAHLPDVHAALARELERRGRSHWAAEEFRRFENAELYRPPVEDRCLKLKGAKKLAGQSLALLERLLEWRDRLAKHHNRPGRVMVRDDVLVEIARRRPRTVEDLHVMRGFQQSRNPRIAAEVLQIIEESKNIPRERWPQPVEEREQTPLMKATVDLLSAVTRAVCFESGVSQDLVGGGQRLRELIDHLQTGQPESPALLSGWRAEFIGGYLVDFLEGKKQLHIAGWPNDPQIEIVAREHR